MDPSGSHDLLNALADPARRAEVAAALARRWRADAVLVLVRDHELGKLCPAPGFVQTLPGGSGWRDLFARCDAPGTVTGIVAFPDRQTLVPVLAEVGADAQAVLVLLGEGVDRMAPPPLDRIGFPLLAALLRAERRAIASAGLVKVADEALARATSLTAALDATRTALADALADADRFNAALRELNTTLEQRVVERTRQLEAEMAERQKAEEQLRQAQKMEAVGQLTGGLAHDFNNLLTGITGSLELLATRIGQGRLAEAERYITAAQGAASRAAALTHRLLAFSRRQTLTPETVDVNRLVAGMEELIRRTVGPGITVGIDGAADLWTVLVDPNQLENALLNLCINARDAMPDGGTLTVSTSNSEAGDCEVGNREVGSCLEGTEPPHEVPPGQYVSVRVGDTGTGMTKEVAARAFDPFFTTKPIGQGTGLGLSMIYGFARQSNGQVRISSEPGHGTVMHLYLPRHHGTVRPHAVPATTAPRQADAGWTVLLVDDEPTVRMLVMDSLQELGYTALEAADGAAGLDILRQDRRIDLLITDVGLPGGMNGRQVADAARMVRPGLKVLFITGYAETAVLDDGQLEPGMHILTKPFAMEALGSRIRRVIEG